MVSYRRNVRGPRKIDVTRKDLLESELRGMAVGGRSIASRSYQLPTGEVHQQAARQILNSLIVEGKRVVKVSAPKPPKLKQKGKRVDDWLIETPDGGNILAEVKASRGLTYFDTAFEQIKNMGKDKSQGVFVGFILRGKPHQPKKALVILVKKHDTLNKFRKLVREMAE
jgi:hypothetical protein